MTAISFGERLAVAVVTLKLQDAIVELERYHEEHDGIEGDYMGFPVLTCEDACVLCKTIVSMQRAVNQVFINAGMPAMYEIEE